MLSCDEHVGARVNSLSCCFGFTFENCTVDDSLTWGHHRFEKRIFEEDCQRRDLQCWDSDLNKSTKIRWRYFNVIDQAVNFTLRGMKVTQRFTQRASEDTRFHMKTQFRKITGRRERINYFQKVTVNSAELKYCLQSLIQLGIIFLLFSFESLDNFFSMSTLSV